MTVPQSIQYAEPELRGATMLALAQYEEARADYERLFRAAVADSSRRQVDAQPKLAEMSGWSQLIEAMREDEAMRDKRPVAVAGDYCRPVEYMSDGTERIRHRGESPNRGRGVDEGLIP